MQHEQHIWIFHLTCHLLPANHSIQLLDHFHQNKLPLLGQYLKYQQETASVLYKLTDLFSQDYQKMQLNPFELVGEVIVPLRPVIK